MTTLEGFEPVAEVTADDRGRITFGKELAGHRSERFTVAQNQDGQLLLTPVTSVPTRELLIWDNPQVRESLQRGMIDAAHGRVHSRDDFLEQGCAGEDDQE